MTFQYMQTFRRKFFAFVEKAQEMRLLQKRYFATRDNLTLAQARGAEKEIDALIEVILDERGRGGDCGTCGTTAEGEADV
jgi:hypothetical protein